MEKPFKLACIAFEQSDPEPLLAYIRGDVDRERALVLLWNMALAFREAEVREVVVSLCEDTEDMARKIVQADQEGKTAIDYVRAYFECILKRVPESGAVPAEQELGRLNVHAKNVYSIFRTRVQEMFNHPS